MTQYDSIPIRQEVLAIHRQQIRSIRSSGTWWTGKERLFFAHEARSLFAEKNNALRWLNIEEQKSKRIEAAKEVVASLARNGKHITRDVISKAVKSGLSEAEYIEIVGVTTRSICLDIFSKGLGLPYIIYENPESTPPTKQKPTSLKNEGAWVQTIPNGHRGGVDSISLYGEMPTPFIFRALSLVPREAKEVMAISSVQYVPAEEFMNLGFSHEASFGRPQVELVAGRTSAINECFY